MNINQLLLKKQRGQKISVLTAWDYLFAQILDQAGVDIILIGDSLAMVSLGHQTTLPLTEAAMLHHAQAVSRGVDHAFLVCDLPFLSYEGNPEQAWKVAGQLLKESKVQSVKVEGAYPAMLDTVEFLTRRGIPVMGHVGLTPQSVHHLGYRKQGKTDEAAERIYQEAIALQSAGAFSMVLEHIPSDLARRITDAVDIPTIGIGAGKHCDGQVLVTADFLGLTEKRPPFAPAYVDLRTQIKGAVESYCQDLSKGQFPIED